MNNYGYIYKTTNLINKKFYIGKRKGVFNSKYFGSGLLLQRALSKYKRDKFKLEIIVYARDKKQLELLEKKYIAEYRELFGKESLYNIAEGGQGGKVCDIHPMKGKHHSEEAKIKMRHPHCKFSEETKENMRKAFSGRILTENHKKNLSKIRIEKGLSKGRNNGMYGVHRYGKDNPRYGKNKRKWMYSLSLNKCSQIKNERIEEHLTKGWIIGRELFKGKNNPMYNYR